MKLCFIGNAGHINLMGWIAHLYRNTKTQIDILTFGEPCTIIDGVNTHILHRPMMNNKMRFFFTIPQAREKIRIIRPDILVGYRINTYGFIAVMANFRPVVVIAQGSDIFFPKKRIVKRAFVKYVIKKADLIHTWANHMCDRLISFGADREKILVLPKGIDTEIFTSTLGKRKKDVLVLISSRQLRKSYNHICILNALPLVIEMVPNLQYLICGDGEYKERLQQHAKRLGIEDHVQFLGEVPHTTLPSFLVSSDIYVSMQSTDGVSGSLLEAMACGLFPIVTDNEANKLWIRDGVNGFLVPPGDHMILAQRIIIALGNPRLRQNAERINVALVKQKASISNNTERTLTTYSKLMKNFEKEKKRHGFPANCFC